MTDLAAADLLALARECGADDAGLVSLDDPALAGERPHIRAAFPAARSVLSLVKRMHREPVRSPARSIANLEFHAVGDEVDEIARALVGRLEAMGVRALNPAMAFPMELANFPSRGWTVSHKIVAEAAGLGKMGLHRSLIHPKFGSFVLLGTVFLAADLEAPARPLEKSPCFDCKLCVAACPVGALKPDGYFDFSACLTHNYQQFMGGFVNFVEDVAASRSKRDFNAKHSYAETVECQRRLSLRLPGTAGGGGDDDDPRPPAGGAPGAHWRAPSAAQRRRRGLGALPQQGGFAGAPDRHRRAALQGFAALAGGVWEVFSELRGAAPGTGY